MRSPYPPRAIQRHKRPRGQVLCKPRTAAPAIVSPSFTITSAGPDDAGQYDVVVSNTGGAVTSAAAVLTVGVLPAITGQPADQQVSEGAAVSFSVTATDAASFQWRKDGVNIDAATAATFALSAAQAGDAGSYDVVISNICGSVTSNAASLAVEVPPSGPPDCGAMLCGPGTVPFVPLTLAGVGWLKAQNRRRPRAHVVGRKLSAGPRHGRE